MTDRDGRFELHGIGRNRVVRLVAKGKRSEFSVFFARTSNVPTETKTQRDPFDFDPRSEESNTVIYGAKFTHAVGPSVPLEGRVTVGKTGQPVSGVVLSPRQIGNYDVAPATEELHAVTDANGYYQLYGLPLGPNRLYATSKTGDFVKRGLSCNIKDDAPKVQLDFTMTEGVVLSGQVLDATSGEPMVGTVEYFGAASNANFKNGVVNNNRRTTEDGRFTLRVVPGEGYLAFRSQHPGYLTGDVDKEATAALVNGAFVRTATGTLFPTVHHVVKTIRIPLDSETTTVQLKVRRQPLVRARLVDVNGKPVNGAMVEEVVTMSRAGFSRSTNQLKLSGSDYTFREFTPEGTTDLIARHEKRQLIGRVSVSLTPRPNLPTVTADPKLAKQIKIQRAVAANGELVKVAMEPAATIRGRVVSQDGSPREVRILGLGPPFLTDDDGRFEGTMVLPHFPVRLRALHSDRPALLGTILKDTVLKPGEVRDLGDVQVMPNDQ